MRTKNGYPNSHALRQAPGKRGNRRSWYWEEPDFPRSNHARRPNRDRFSVKMLSLDDKRWEQLSGGYRTQFDPRAAFSKLESNTQLEYAWDELWEGLHHQGDVGEASYAAVPHLVRIYRLRRADRWLTFGLVALIELARERGTNPVVPNWLAQDYFQAIQDLADIGSSEVMSEGDADAIRAILSVIAIAKGARAHARLLFEYSDEEMIALEKQLLGN